MDQPCKVVTSAPGQLNRENVFPYVSVRALDFAHARQVWPSRPTSARYFKFEYTISKASIGTSACAVVVQEIRDTEGMRRIL